MMTALCDRVLELNDAVADWAFKTCGNASPPMARPPIFRKWRREWPSQYAAGFWPRMESIAWFPCLLAWRSRLRTGGVVQGSTEDIGGRALRTRSQGGSRSS